MPDITITIPGCSCCASPAPCTVCSSSVSNIFGQVGPTWTGLISGYVDQYPIRLTAAQQSVGGLLSGTPIHNNINGVSLPLTATTISYPYVLRSASYGFRSYGFSGADATALAPFWDEIAALATSAGPCAIDTLANYIANGYFISSTAGGSVQEQAGISVLCPEYNYVDTTGTKLGVYIVYSFQIQLTVSNSNIAIGDKLTLSRNLQITTYTETDISSLGCPVNATILQTTNSLITNGAYDRVLLTTYNPLGPTTTVCYDVGTIAGNIPFGGSLLLTE